jgi:hypothetical protein
MALVKIEGAKVTRIMQGYGFRAEAEIAMRNGDTRTERYTVWSESGVSEGDIVDIVGNLGVKIEDFTGRDGSLKTVAAIHVNDAKVTTAVSAPF